MQSRIRSKHIDACAAALPLPLAGEGRGGGATRGLLTLSATPSLSFGEKSQATAYAAFPTPAPPSVQTGDKVDGCSETSWTLFGPRSRGRRSMVAIIWVRKT